MTTSRPARALAARPRAGRRGATSSGSPRCGPPAARSLFATARHAAAARRPRSCRRPRRSSRSRSPTRSRPARRSSRRAASVAVFRDAEGVYAISTHLHAPRLHREARRRGLRLSVPRLALRAGRLRHEGARAPARWPGARSPGAAARYVVDEGAGRPAGHEGEGMSATLPARRKVDARHGASPARPQPARRAAPRQGVRVPRRRADRPTARARPSSSATSSSTCIPCARTAGASAGRRRGASGIAGDGRVPDHAGDRRPPDVLLQALSGRGLPLDQGHPLRRPDGPVHPQHPPLGRERDGRRRASCTWPASFYTAAYREPPRVQLAGRAWPCWSTRSGLSFTGYLLPVGPARLLGDHDRREHRAVAARGHRRAGHHESLRSRRAPAAAAPRVRHGGRGGADPLLPAARDDPAARRWRPSLAVHFWRIRKDGGLARPADADARVGAAGADTYPVFTEAPAEDVPPRGASCAGGPRRSGAGPENTVPSMPHLFYAELAVLMLTMLVCLALAIVSDAPLKELANPSGAREPGQGAVVFPRPAGARLVLGLHGRDRASRRSSSSAWA